MFNLAQQAGRMALLFFFLFSSFSLVAQKAEQIALEYIQKNMKKQGFVENDIKNMVISDSYYSKSTDTYHVYYQQTHKGIRVYNAIYNLAIKNGRVFHSNHTFVPRIAKKVNVEIPLITPKAGLEAAAFATKRDGSSAKLLQTFEDKNQSSTKYTFDKAGISEDDITVELYWETKKEFQKGDKHGVQLSWRVIINDDKSADWWNIRVNAENGEILAQDNFTVYCDFGHAHEHGEICVGETYNHKHTIQKEEKSVAFANNDYNVFDYPLESPSHGNRTIVNSPYARFTPSRAGLGATNGWHHTSNTTNFTITRGNNVWAMEDVNANNGTGFSPDAGASLDFNYPYSLGATPAANQNTAITNLFYWNNLVHDVLYNYGFDEECGNFQQTNVDGAGGNGGDYVIADAQDGGGTNNANFSTPGDGTNGRMQMFLWSPQTSNTQLDVNPPSGIAGTYSAVESGFSTANKLSALGPITGDLVLANDIEACTANPITNGVAINGNIAVIDRGVCGFTEKVANAEAAGAIAVLVCNNVAGAAIIMGGTDNSITTPAVMLSLAECNTIKMAMSSNTVNITMTGGIAYTPDGDFDNGIVAHEYGHGWSTRATGGPGTSCLSGDEQQGEGWADFLALMLCTDWASLSPDVASANIPRGIGTYAQGQPISGGGIRPFQYSYDMAGVNSFVDYTNVGNATFTIPHGVGSMWCTMLWDMTWEIILQDNFIQTDIWDTSTLEGNVAAFKLVHEGLKLQPCAPGFVTSRDAILAADEELFNGKYKCSIWRAFARRGLGVDADQGSSVSVTDGTADYSLPGGVGVTKTANKLDFAQGETVTYTVTANCNCVDENNVTLEDILPSGLTYVAGSATAGGTESGGTITWGPVNLAANSATSYTYQATVNTGTESTPFVVVNDNLDGSAPAGFWTTSSDWTLTNNPTGPLAACSGNGYFAPDNATASDESLVLAFTLNGPATTLTFTHTYDTEADANGGWDGGIVEISTNSGTSWTDLGLNMTSNGYNTVSQSFGTPMFSGNSGGCISTSIDLAGYCGDIQVRFRMLCDAAEGGNGWLVDNIQVNSITGILNKADAIQSATSIGTGCACIEVTNIILPIELVEISATAEDKRVRLDWTTATETNNEGFQVERSTNPNNGFQKIGWVKGNGNTVSESNYEFDDANVRAGVLYYYRLKQMDFDEKYEYSQTVSARIKGKSEVVFYPNPAKNFVFIQSLETWTGQVTLILRTIDGKTALRQIVDGQQLEQGLSLPLDDMIQGTYILEIGNTEYSTIKKLIVE